MSKKKSHLERFKERREEYNKKAMERKKKRAISSRKRAARESRKRLEKKIKNHKQKQFSEKQLKYYNAQLEAEEARSKKDVLTPPKSIGPELQQELFSYYMTGASCRQIQKRLGHKYKFSLHDLYIARDFYKWKERKVAIHKTVRNDSDMQIVERMKTYVEFLDDLMSEAMMRFKDNTENGMNNNPFNNLKATNMQDVKTIIDLMMNIMHGGIKKVDVNHGGNVRLTGQQSQEILNILANPEDNEEDE